MGGASRKKKNKGQKSKTLPGLDNGPWSLVRRIMENWPCLAGTPMFEETQVEFCQEKRGRSRESTSRPGDHELSLETRFWCFSYLKLQCRCNLSDKHFFMSSLYFISYMKSIWIYMKYEALPWLDCQGMLPPTIFGCDIFHQAIAETVRPPDPVQMNFSRLALCLSNCTHYALWGSAVLDHEFSMTRGIYVSSCTPLVFTVPAESETLRLELASAIVRKVVVAKESTTCWHCRKGLGK